MRPSPSLYYVSTLLEQRRRRHHRAQRLWGIGLTLLGLGLLLVGWWVTLRLAPSATPQAAAVSPAGLPALPSGAPGLRRIAVEPRWEGPVLPGAWGVSGLRLPDAGALAPGLHARRRRCSRRSAAALVHARALPEAVGAGPARVRAVCPCRREGRSPTPRPQDCPRGKTTPRSLSPPPPARPLPVPRPTPSDAQSPRTRSSRGAGGRGGCGPLAPSNRRRPSHPSDACRTMRPPSLQNPSGSRSAREHAKQTSLRSGCPVCDTCRQAPYATEPRPGGHRRGLVSPGPVG